MSKLIFSLLSWLLPARPAIYSSHFGPYLTRLPTYLHDRFNSADTYPGWCEASVIIENISKQTLSTVRIKLRRKYCAKPEIIADHQPYSDWEFNEEKGEIIVRALDPKVKIYIKLFLSLEDRGEIQPEIFVDGRLHGKAQQYIAHYSKIFTGTFGLAFGGMVIILLGFFFYIYSTSISPCTFQESDACRILKATGRISGFCQFKVESVTTDTLGNIQSSSFPTSLTLFINKAKSTEDLLSMDKIVVCAPSPESH